MELSVRSNIYKWFSTRVKQSEYHAIDTKTIKLWKWCKVKDEKNLLSMSTQKNKKKCENGKNTLTSPKRLRHQKK